MSYNAYPNSNHSYSPYYQQSNGQDGRTQYTEQPRGNHAYQNSSYQPLSAYQSSQAPQPSTAQSTNAGTAYNDPAYGGGAGGGRQDSRAGYNDGRSSVDTTALGNLAYASSLGRDNSNLQQLMSYNRAQNTAGYNTPAAYGTNSGNPVQYGTGHQRTENSRSAGTLREDSSRAQPATASPSFGYSANDGNTVYQSQQTKAAPAQQAQAHYASSQFSQSPGEQHRMNQYSKPSRPPSGQAIHRPKSTTSSQGVSPTVAPAQNVHVHSDGNFRRVSTSAQSEKPRMPTPQQHTTAETSTGPKSGSYSQYTQSKQVASGFAPNNAAQTGVQTSSTNNPYNRSQPSNNFHNSTENQNNGQRTQDSTPTDNQFPITVNPSQVFNDVEYQRRQAAAAAEAEAARKKAEDDRIATIPKKDTPKIPAPTHAEGKSSNPPGATSDADAAKKEQMELEMKQMIEKMRDYKTKDPSLFSQIWEQVKKGQPAQRASPQIVTQGSSASPIVINEQLPSPVVQLPPESELPAADGESFPPNFDRGRFPAQRRRRGGANFTPEKKKQATPKGSAKSTTGGSNTDPVNQTMKRAMADFHSNSGSPMPTTNQTPAPPPPKEKQAQPTPTPMPASKPSTTPTTSAGSQAQNKPSPPKAGGTYWPENKKRQLAEAARVALTSTRQNVGKEITTDEIHQLLDQNPSYTQMCEILEYRGFVIDRGQFARLLLSAVPDLGSASTPKTPAKPPSHEGVPTPSSAPPPNGMPVTAQPPPPESMPQAGPPGPLPYSVPRSQQTNDYITHYAPQYQTGQYPAPQAQMTPASSGPSRDYRSMNPDNPTSIDLRRQYVVPQQASRVYSGPAMMHPQAPFPPPPPSADTSAKNKIRWVEKKSRPADVNHPQPTTKQDMARKRNFGEIVDLTQAVSDDDEPLHQRPRVDDASAIRVFTAGRSVNSGTATPTSVKDTTSLEEFRHKPTGKDAYLRAPDIIRPMNKRQDALRRSSYDPKTIARDILLAIGKHPTMAPLNSHLDVLRERFTAVNSESDLSTFRWDLVDPGGPPPVQHATVDEDLHQSRRSTGKHVRPHVAVVVGGRGPMEVESGQGRRRNEAFKPTRGGYLAPSIRPKPAGTDASTNLQTPQSNSTSSQGGVIRTSLSDSGFSRFVHNDLPVMLNNITGTSGTTPIARSFEASTPASGSAARIRVPGRVGRPPGAKNRNPRPDKGTPKNPKPTQHQDNSPKGRVTPNTHETSARSSTLTQNHATPVRTPSSSLQNRPHISTTPSRPSGLRHAVSPSDGIAVVIPSRSPSVMEGSPAVSVRSSVKKAAFQPNVKQSPAPSYKVYKCCWDRCPAELHNLETLRKHVRKHRSNEDFEKGLVPCLWADCYNNDRERLTFRSVEAWDKHVTRDHVEAAAGNSTHSSGDESSEDPSDAHSLPVIQKPKVISRGGPSSVVPSSMRPMVVLPS